MSHVRLIGTMVPVAETSRASVPSEACVATRLAGAPWAGAWGVGEEVRGVGWQRTVRGPVGGTGALASVLSNLR